jgi:myo-inositol-1(or 4)-monophosphatase
MLDNYSHMMDPFDFAHDLAIRTGSLLRTFYNPAGLQAVQKADHTVVTQADIAADQFITHAIQEQYPQDKIISEESSHLLENTQSPTWIIDPLDGTTNFSLGLSIWGVSIARLVNGYPDLGVIYFPLINELYCARRGVGASLNNTSITTRAPDASQQMSFFACCSRTFRYYDINIPYKPRIMGSAAYSFCMLARGAASLAFDAAPKIWDLAAVWLLVEEAGGRISAFDGLSPFPSSSSIDYGVTNFPTLASANADIFSFGYSRIQNKSISTFEIDHSD